MQDVHDTPLLLTLIGAAITPSAMADIEEGPPSHELDEKEPSVQQVEDIHEDGNPALDAREERR